MVIMQETTTVKVNIHTERVAHVIEWDCPECDQHNKEYTYCADSRNILKCERCGKTFTGIKEGD